MGLVEHFWWTVEAVQLLEGDGEEALHVAHRGGLQAALLEGDSAGRLEGVGVVPGRTEPLLTGVDGE